MLNSVVCPHCGAHNPADARYCDQCSLPLQAAPAQPIAPTPPAAPAGASVPMVPPSPPPPAAWATSAPPAAAVGVAPPPPADGATNAPSAAAGGAAPPVARRAAQSGPPLLLIGVALAALAAFLIGGGMIMGGTLAGGAPATVAPTPNLQATIAAMMQTQQPQQTATLPAGPAATQVAAATRPPATLPAPTLAPTHVAQVVPTLAPTVAPTVAEPTAVSAPATPAPPTAAPAGPTATALTVVTIPLSALNGSGEQGTAVLTEEYDLGTRIVLQLSGAPSKPQPAHIHLGTCDNIAPKPSYPLKNVVNGRSETLLPISFSELRRGVYLINVHTSETQLEPYVACGEIR